MSGGEVARVVIVGAGHAGFNAAASLRASGYAGPIHLVTEEAEHPYERPPLSKDYLLGKRTRQSLCFRNADFFISAGIHFEPNGRAVSIDRSNRRVEMADGTQRPYDALILATGARNRSLELPGSGSMPVHMIRRIEDVDALQERLGDAGSVAILGGGFIGLELAAPLRAMDKHVTLIEAQSRLLQRAVPELVSEYLRDLHRAHGVNVLLSETAVSAARTDTGRIRLALTAADLEVDVLAAGIGVVANDELAREAGLETANGIVVDQTLRTSDPAIYAIGDCARIRAGDGGLIRIESVQNALDQARHVARVLTGESAPYAAIPWFWSDQYDCKLQIAGLPVEPDALLVKGDRTSGHFSVASMVHGRLACVHSISAPADHVKARRLLAGAEPADVETMLGFGYSPAKE